MDVKAILRVAENVASSPTFDMSDYSHECGTPACIAGHTLGKRGLDKVEQDIGYLSSVECFDRAQAILGLDSRQAKELFMPENDVVRFDAPPDSPQFITNKHAAACLRELAKTGNVDWEGTRPK